MRLKDFAVSVLELLRLSKVLIGRKTSKLNKYVHAIIQLVLRYKNFTNKNIFSGMYYKYFIS